MPLRVLHCVTHGRVGGAERAVHLLVREQLKDPELAPALLFGERGGTYWEEAQTLGCPVITLDLTNGRAIGRLGDAVAAMRPFDIHHFHSAEPLVMLASARCEGVRRVYTHRGGITRYRAGKRLRYELTGLMLRRRFHAFSGNTGVAATFASDLFRIDPERFATTYNGLEFDLLEPHRAADEVRAELGLTNGAYVVGTAANLRDWKRIDRLLTAIAHLDDPHLHLVIVGDGPDRDRLQGLARSLGVTDRVSFTGVQTHVGDYLQVMDAFSLPSNSLESFGNAAVEAMAMGLPTVVFADGGGLLEHVENDVTGFVATDQADLEEILRRLAADRASGEAVGAAGRESTRSRYTPEAAAARYRRLYAAALPDHAAA
jgi:glycosyltransferase involved in cell wall biosynthesis